MPNEMNATAPVSLFGAPRSGTTLISSVFRLHKDNADRMVGETGNLIFGMWRSFEFARGVTLPLRDGEQLLSEEERAGKAIRAALVASFPDDAHGWFHKPIGLPKAVSELFGDDEWNEAAEWFWSAWASIFPDGHHMVVLRHPCDVLLSQLKVMGFDAPSLWWSFAFVMHICAHSSAPKNMHVVHYDDLVARPEAVVREMLEAVGMPFDRNVMEAFDQVHVAAPDRTQSGSGSRRSSWGDLSAADLNPRHKLAIDQAFEQMGHPIEWPEHLANPAADAPESLTDAERLVQQADDIERMHKRVETMNFDFAAERRHLREEKQRWQNFVNRHRHQLPVRLDLETELDRQLGEDRPAPAEPTAVRSDIDPGYVRRIETEIDHIYASRTWRVAEKLWRIRWEAKQKVREGYDRSPEPAKAKLRALNERRQSAAEETIKQDAEIITPSTLEPSTVLSLPSGVTLGGVTTWSIELAGLLAPKGAVRLIRHPDIGTPLDTDLPDGVPVITATSKALPPKSAVQGYAAEYAPALPAVLVPNYNWAGYAFAAELSKKRASELRTIGYAHTDQLHYFTLLEYYEPMIHRFIAVSEEIGEKLRFLLPDRVDDIEVRPYGVHVAKELTRSHTPAAEPLRLVYAGRIEHEQKRVLRLLQLARMLVKYEVSFTLDIVGKGPASAELEARLAELSDELGDRVAVYPAVAPHEMAELWSTHDVCILVSEYEGTSIAMLEAMAHGCLPVVTKVSGTDAVIEDGVNGFATERDELRPMVERLSELAADREMLSSMASAAHATVLDRYDFADYAEAFGELTADVWKQEPRIWTEGRPLLPASRDAHEAYIARRLGEFGRSDRL